VSIAFSARIGLKLAEAFGLSTHRLRSFTLHVERNDVIYIDATYVVEDHGDLVERVRRLNLTCEPPEADTATMADAAHLHEAMRQ
jgi:hypothetical protein